METCSPGVCGQLRLARRGLQPTVSTQDTLCPCLGFTDSPRAGQTPLTDTQQMGLGPPVREGQNQAEPQGRDRGLWAGSSSCSAQGHWLESGSL